MEAMLQHGFRFRILLHIFHKRSANGAGAGGQLAEVLYDERSKSRLVEGPVCLCCICIQYTESRRNCELEGVSLILQKLRYKA